MIVTISLAGSAVVATTSFALIGLLVALAPLVAAGTVLSTVITSRLTKMATAGDAVSCSLSHI